LVEYYSGVSVPGGGDRVNSISNIVQAETNITDLASVGWVANSNPTYAALRISAWLNIIELRPAESLKPRVSGA